MLSTSLFLGNLQRDHFVYGHIECFSFHCFTIIFNAFNFSVVPETTSRRQSFFVMCTSNRYKSVSAAGSSNLHFYMCLHNHTNLNHYVLIDYTQ